MRRPARRFIARLAGAAAATGLAIAGLVVVAAPANAAACSGTTGVTVIVDTGSSISTRCAGGTPGSAWDALTSAGFAVTRVDMFPGAICQIEKYPKTSCLRMPPGNAYWAFFHAKRGGSWVYSSSGAKSYGPASGSVVGFRFGSGQQPGIAPPAPTKTSAPAPTKTTPKPTPKPPTATPRPKPKPKPKPAPSAPKTTSGSTSSTPAGEAAPTAPAKGKAPSSTAAPSGTPSASPTASATNSASATGTPTASPSETASDLAAAPTSVDANDGGGGPGTLLAGAALVALVAGGAGFAAWKRRS
jgi:hypothetical protein